jgi:hypothetical protein
MDHWAWQHLNAWLDVRVSMRVGALRTHPRPPVVANRCARDPTRPRRRSWSAAPVRAASASSRSCCRDGP